MLKIICMEMDQIHRHVKCCACEGELMENPCVVQVPVTITWGFPKWGNFLTGIENQGVAFVCDSCNGPSSRYTDIKNVVEFFPTMA